jgi:hypothetical protein
MAHLSEKHFQHPKLLFWEQASPGFVVFSDFRALKFNFCARVIQNGTTGQYHFEGFAFWAHWNGHVNVSEIVTSYIHARAIIIVLAAVSLFVIFCVADERYRLFQLVTLLHGVSFPMRLWILREVIARKSNRPRSGGGYSLLSEICFEL